MFEFQVQNIVDYNKIETEGWQLEQGENTIEGNTVIIRGMPNIENDVFAKERVINRLKITLSGKKVGLQSGEVLDNGEILCDVFIQGINVSNYFSDFK